MYSYTDVKKRSLLISNTNSISLMLKLGKPFYTTTCAIYTILPSWKKIFD